MPYEKQNIPAFEGVNLGVEPDAVRDSQASDMLNLRFTKVGYLVNRNGVRAFEFDHTVEPQLQGLYKISGATAIGEFILSAPVTDKVDFDPLGNDTVASVVNASHSYPLAQYDRFMVYGVRGANVSEPNKARLAYVLVPTGPIPDGVQSWAIDNDISTPPQNQGDCVFFLRPEYAGDTNSATAALPSLLTAPARRLQRGLWIDTVSGTIHDNSWIEHYQRMEQYGNSLVIADRQNGDLIIHDSWDEAETGQTKSHKLRLQENCNAFFDVDAVKVDFQLGSGEKNGGGVEHGMALYKFYLQRRNAIAAMDNYQDSAFSSRIGELFGNLDSNSGYIEFVNELQAFRGALFFGYNVSDVNASEDRYRGGVDKSLLKDTIGKQYVFSDYAEPSEIESLLDPVTQSNPALSKQYDSEGKIINNEAADVYLWNDVKVTYYPCTGKDTESKFLIDSDRPWAKKVPTLPRIVELETKAGIKQKVPLGVWAYRYVWDLGNQEYSSPSAPMLIPDKLWSCIPDQSGIVRPIKFSGAYADHTHDEIHQTYSGINVASGTGQSLLFTGELNLAANSIYADVLTKVKSALYDSTHVFGGSAQNVNKQVLCTVTSNGPERALRGTILSGYQFDITENSDGTNHYDITLAHHHKSKLIVPIAKVASNEFAVNALFTEDVVNDAGVVGGMYRRAMVDTSLIHQDTLHEFIFEGANNAFCISNDETNYSTYDLHTIKYKTDIYYGLIIHEDDRDVVNGDAPDSLRVPTVLRYVGSQPRRLAYTKIDANPEALSRILAEGIAQFVLADYTNSIVCRSQLMGSYEYDNIPFLGTQTSKLNTKTGSWAYSPSVPQSIDDGVMIIGDLGYDIVDYIAQNNPNYDTIKLGTVKSFIGGAPDLLTSQGTLWPYLSSKNTPLPWVSGSGSYPPNTVNWSGTGAPEKWFEVNNVRIAIHLEGERLLIPEQASAFFPSSLLFNAPRVKLTIDKNSIPSRAKGILIFRTLATHDNDWQPTRFGLVEQVKLDKDANGQNVDFEYFDEVKDTDLDFATTPDEFDGIVDPLRSLFVKSLKEKVWYGNIVERYQPYAPRGYVDNIENASGTGPVPDLTPAATYPVSKVASWKELIVDDTPENRTIGYTDTLNGKYHEYFIVFKDLNGEHSDVKLLSDNGSPTYVDFTSVTSNQLTAVALILSGYPYNAGIEECAVYRRSYTLSGGQKSDTAFYKIGTIKPEAEGIFVDTGIDTTGASKWGQYDDTADTWPVSSQREDKLESSIAWSESGQPSWIKYDSRFAFRDGDGDQITGMEVIYSELIVFKERSMHRVTLENLSNNIGRVEEVSNTVGCIAPNTILCYDNTIYFLSWHGFMKYDNNGLSKVDGDFAIEIGARLREEFQGIRNPAIRDASVALNPVYRELYLNIPAYAGQPAYDYKSEGVKGHIYVMNLDNKFVTKFQYETGDAQIFTPLNDPNDATTSGTDPRTMARLYYTNSYGQLWSAETLPKTPYVSSKVYLEAPTDRDYDEFQPGITASGAPETVSKIVTEPVHSWWKSKEWTGGDKSILKRLRMIIANIAKGTNPRVGTEFNNDDYSTAAYRESQFGVTGELKVVPSRRIEGSDRGERMTIHIASEGDTEIQGLGFHWRKVNTWTR